MGVVAIHTIIFNFEPYSLTGGSVAVFRNLLGCCVPFFVAVSGYFLCNKEISTRFAYSNFIKTRLLTVYRPMLIWGLPWLLLGLLSVKKTYKLLLRNGYVFFRRIVNIVFHHVDNRALFIVTTYTKN